MRTEPRFSLAGRLAAAHLALAALAVALALGFLYWRVGGVIDAEQRQVVEAELQGLVDSYGQGGAGALAQAIAGRLSREDGRDAVYLLTEADGRRIAGNLQSWPPTVAPGSGWVQLNLYRTDRRAPTTISGLTITLPEERRLLVARDVAARAAFDAGLRAALIWALAGAALVAAMSGWIVSRMVRRRIGGIDAAAKRIMAGDLDSRAPVKGSGDEFDRLAATLNAMLDRIGALVGDLRMVTDSLAHDLRGPLGRAIRRIETARRERDPLRRDELMISAEAEAHRVLEMSAALLDVSRIEAGIGRDQFENLDLAALARDVSELYEAAAEESGLRLRVDAPVPVLREGHRQLLAQALSNLIDNAMRHSPKGREIVIEADEDGLAVRDHGPGLPPEARARMLARFTRHDPARGGQGFGLGLSLVAATARLHGGEAALEDADPGLRAMMRIPVW